MIVVRISLNSYWLYCKLFMINLQLLLSEVNKARLAPVKTNLADQGI